MKEMEPFDFDKYKNCYDLKKDFDKFIEYHTSKFNDKCKALAALEASGSDSHSSTTYRQETSTATTSSGGDAVREGSVDLKESVDRQTLSRNSPGRVRYRGTYL